MRTSTVVAFLFVSAVACSKQRGATRVDTVPDRSPDPKPAEKKLSRAEFNLRAAELFLPLFWREDKNQNGTLDPDELAVLWGLSTEPGTEWVTSQGQFTQRFLFAHTAMLLVEQGTSLDERERVRRTRVKEELAQGRPTLIETDFSSATDEEKKIVEHVTRAAAIIERIHAKQLGVHGLEQKIPADDAASKMLFHRNSGPYCVAPKTENNPDCSALPERPKRLSGLYPADIQANPKFCDALSKEPNAKALMDHFSVVTHKASGGFEAVPYNVAYREDMEAVAKELDAAAAAIQSPTERAFKTYLTQAACAFRSNNWEPANEAWAAMGAENSAWYLRIAPDEVYFEPCAWKAGFAVSFARINRESLAWQKKLEPVKAEMEKAVATLAGPPYRARNVKFKLPDFIDIVLNAGDARPPHGATIGQSLPNWGKVAARGGRTVVMTNLYTDVDSRQALTEQMASLFCADTMKHASADPKAALMSIVLHEAAHNLGPSHEYKVRGKVDDEVFGGPLSSTLEELKAQTASLYFSGWLASKKVITEEEATRSNVRDIAWAFGHISRGMYTSDGSPKNYSQLASIQLGVLRKSGVLVWSADQQAANGQDVGCFDVKLDRWGTAVEGLAKQSWGIKSRGDKAAAEKLKAELVDAQDEWAELRATITERWLRAPKASFVYAIRR